MNNELKRIEILDSN